MSASLVNCETLGSYVISFWQALQGIDKSMQYTYKLCGILEAIAWQKQLLILNGHLLISIQKKS